MSTPLISSVSVTFHETLHFTLSNINVSFANALRRTILSDIPINVIRTETNAINQCKVFINTTRLHNEIIKQRLSCIPIHIPLRAFEKEGEGESSAITTVDPLRYLPDNFILEVDMSNDTENTVYITTEHFVLKPKDETKQGQNQNLKELSKQVFPSHSISHHYIDFARLRGKIDGTRVERLHLQAEFSVATAKENSMFNVASICTYSNTVDFKKADAKWEEERLKMTDIDTEQDLLFRKKNFYILDAQRCFTENSFDFVLKSVGVYDNKTILLHACNILIDNFRRFENSVKDKSVTFVKNSNITLDECYDLYIRDLDCYTYGKCLEAVYYNNYFATNQIIFCGFKKFHPHDSNAILRIAYPKPVGEETLYGNLQDVIQQCIFVFQHISNNVNTKIS